MRAEPTDPQLVDIAIGVITEKLGAIDIFVNNATWQTHAGFEEMRLEEWRGMIATNLDGVFIVTRAMARGMIARGSGGAIVNVASIEGLQPAPTHGHYAGDRGRARDRLGHRGSGAWGRACVALIDREEASARETARQLDPGSAR